MGFLDIPLARAQAASTSTAGTMSAADKLKVETQLNGNMFIDGSFEQGSGPVVNSYFASREVVAGGARTGEKCLEITGDGTSDQSALFALYPVAEGRSYRLSGWFKAGAATVAGAFVRWGGVLTKADGVTSFIAASAGLTLTSSWQEHTYLYTVPGGSGYKLYQPRVYANDMKISAGLKFLMDDLRMEDVTDVVALVTKESSLLASASKQGLMSAADKALLDTATHAATGDSLAKRYSSGSLHVVTGTSPNDAANKGYVDAETAKRALTGHGHAAATSSADGFMSAADKALLDAASSTTTNNSIVKRSGTGNIYGNVFLTDIATQSTSAASLTRKDYVDSMSQKPYRAYTMADAPTVYGPGVTTFLAADTDGWNWGNGQNFANVVTAKSSFTGGTTQWAYPYRSETLPPLVRYWKDAATAWGPWHTMASQAYVDKISAGAAVASDAAMGKLVAFGFENSEMTARGYTVSGATMTPLPGVAQLANANSTYGLRDPSIARMNGNYYLAATKPLKSNYLGTGATAMQLHVSNNLADWTPLADIPAGVTGATRAWAPELFVDGPDVYVYYSVTTDTTQDASLITTFDIYARKASNPELTAWGSAVKMTGLVTPKSLDAHVTRADDARGKYVMFFKDETNMNICRAWAGSPLGPWTTDKTGAWLGHSTATEGPQLMRLPGGTWRLFYDRYVNDQLAYRDSTDLDTWTAETTLTYSPRLRHPGYLWLTPAESNALATRHRAVRAYTGAAISIPHNALTAVPLSNSQGDTAFWSSANPTRFTADAPGWYSLSFTLLWTSNATGQRSASMRFSNGAVIVYKDSRAATTGGMGTEHGGEDRNFFLAAGEYVEVMGLQLSGAALTVNAVASFVREG